MKKDSNCSREEKIEGEGIYRHFFAKPSNSMINYWLQKLKEGKSWLLISISTAQTRKHKIETAPASSRSPRCVLAWSMIPLLLPLALVRIRAKKTKHARVNSWTERVSHSPTHSHSRANARAKRDTAHCFCIRPPPSPPPIFEPFFFLALGFFRFCLAAVCVGGGGRVARREGRERASESLPKASKAKQKPIAKQSKAHTILISLLFWRLLAFVGRWLAWAGERARRGRGGGKEEGRKKERRKKKRSKRE